jgi:hypothetical protein
MSMLAANARGAKRRELTSRRMVILLISEAAGRSLGVLQTVNAPAYAV